MSCLHHDRLQAKIWEHAINWLILVGSQVVEDKFLVGTLLPFIPVCAHDSMIDPFWKAQTFQDSTPCPARIVSWEPCALRKLLYISGMDPFQTQN